MPYTSIANAKSAGFPTQAEGIPMTIAQINKLASIYDAIKNAGKVRNPFAVAWTQWKKLFKKVGDKWISMSEIASMRKGAQITFPISVGDLKFAEEGNYNTEIQVLQVGSWKHPAYGKIKINENDVGEFIKNFDSGVRKDIPITEGHSVGDEELPAVGWFRQLVNKGRDGLWAVIEWTKLGKKLLQEKAYKYFSPEFYSTYEDPETHKVYNNVLVGGALTNRPYFKGLQAIVLSELTFDDTIMELKDILEKDPSELTDEETEYLKGHREELTDEQKKTFESVLKEGDEEETEEKEEEEKEEEKEEETEEKEEEGEDDEKKGSEKVLIDKKTLSFLEKGAKAGAEAAAALRRKDAEVYASGMTFSESNKTGTFLPKSKGKVVEFLLSLTEAQQKKFKEILAELPKAKLFSELGKESGLEIKASDKIQELVKAKMAADSGLEYRPALEQVFAENPELAEQTGNE